MTFTGNLPIQNPNNAAMPIAIETGVLIIIKHPRIIIVIKVTIKTYSPLLSTEMKFLDIKRNIKEKENIIGREKYI